MAILADASALARVFDKAYLQSPLELERGRLEPAESGATVLDPGQTCEYVQQEWRWPLEDCAAIDRIVFDFLPSVAGLVVYKPVSVGRIPFDEGTSNELDAEIGAIWEALESGLRERGRSLGVAMHPQQWRLFPSVNEEDRNLSYAIDLNRGGVTSLNVRAARFDRKGYVAFMILPARSDLSERELRYMIADVLASYQPYPQAGYTQFREGDRVAPIGPVGVLANLIGVGHAPSSFALALDVAIERAREFWYLSFLSVALFARRLFRRPSAV